MDVLKSCVLNAAKASFLPENEKTELIDSLKKELKI